MPNIFLTIPESHANITRPVTTKIAKDLLAIMGIPTDTSILYPSHHGTTYQTGSTLTPGTEPNEFAHDRRFQLEVTEEYVEDNTLTTAIHRPENVVIFHDPHLDVIVRPIYTTVEVSVRVNFRSPDKTSADQWRADCRLRASDGRAELLHTVDYHYPIPSETLVILHEIHRLRENVSGYGEDLKAWFTQYMTQRRTVLTTQAGTEARLVIAERQVGVLGWFDFTTAPVVGQGDGSSAAFTTGFEYRFRYDKVTGCQMHYPLMIHNQVIGSRYRDREPIYRPENYHRIPSFSKYSMDTIANDRKAREGVLMEGFGYPYFDDWLPLRQPAKLRSVLRFMLSVGDDPHEVINLAALGPFSFDPVILRYLTKNAEYLHIPGESMILLTLFDGDLPKQPTALTCDAALNVRTTQPLNPRNRYHLQVGLLTDLTQLSPDAVDRLVDDVEAFEKIIEAIRPGTGPIHTIGKDHIPGREYDRIRDELNQASRGAGNRPDMRMLTVGLFSIITHRGKQDANR